MKLIRTTKTGAYYRMNDGRVGYANHQYARISVKREGLRNGKYHRSDNEISDRAYQINKCRMVPSQWGMMKERIRYNSKEEAIQALLEYEKNNCNEIAQIKSEKDLYRHFYEAFRINHSEKRYERKYYELINGLHKFVNNSEL